MEADANQLSQMKSLLEPDSDSAMGRLCGANVVSFLPIQEAVNGLSPKCKPFSRVSQPQGAEQEAKPSVLRVRLPLFSSLKIR